MKIKTLAAALAAFSLSATAFAQSDRSLYFLLTGGLTYGGDSLVETYYDDGTSSDIRAGNLVQFGTGLLWQSPNQLYSLQATVNYHIDDADGARFDRVPLELLAYYNGVPSWRFGGGLRYSLNPTLKADSVWGYGDTKVKFKDALGLVLEAGYRIAPAAWINGRVGIEKYDPKSVEFRGRSYSVSDGEKVDGTHFGVNVVWGF